MDRRNLPRDLKVLISPAAVGFAYPKTRTESDRTSCRVSLTIPVRDSTTMDLYFF